MLAVVNMQSIVLTHILQFSIAITLFAVLIAVAGRRFPHFAFLVCMLALAKCLVPPLITSPAGIFTLHSGLAFSPQFQTMNAGDLVRFKQFAALDERPSDGVLSQSLDSNTDALAAVDSWTWSFLTVWVAGVVVVSVLAFWQYAKLRALIRKSHRAPEKIQSIAKTLQLQLNFRRRVEVLVSHDNFGPACVGILRPRLIIPQAIAVQWSERLLRPVLAHELVHARRGDIAWGFVQFVAQVVWWFHPLVWWLSRRASLYCERCCDEEVVASTDCSAGDYAESLVRVLELRSECRTVPLCHAMSPSQITSQRLERLMKRYGKFSKRTSSLGWGLIALLAVLVIPGMRWAVAQDGAVEPAKEAEYRLQVQQAIENGDWAAATTMLTPIVEADPNNGEAVFYLGFALHASGNIDEAIKYHALAAGFPKTKPIGLYNWACALALKGEKQQAMEKLTAAVDAGFVHQSDLSDDSDLASLIDTDEFRSLSDKIKNRRPDFNFWIGSWDVRDAEGKSEGSNTITASDEGRVLIEKWTSASGGTGTSINYFHPGKQKWVQTWVDDKGGVIEYEGNYKDGKMQFEGTAFGVKGKMSRSRMSFTPKTDGTVEQLMESSADSGQTWVVSFKGIYHPKRSKAARVTVTTR